MMFCQHGTGMQPRLMMQQNAIIMVAGSRVRIRPAVNSEQKND